MTLRAEGFDVLRFTNRDVGANVTGVLEQILSRLQSLPDRWPGSGPTPTPPLKGRGFK
jgi:very-short-patch-repair endonuclease